MCIGFHVPGKTQLSQGKKWISDLTLYSKLSQPEIITDFQPRKTSRAHVILCTVAVCLNAVDPSLLSHSFASRTHFLGIPSL